MGSNKVNLRLRDGPHANLVETSREESRKGAAEDHVSVATGQANPHAADILLCDETLHVALGEGVLVGEGEGRVLRVSIQGHDAVETLAKFHQGIAVDLPCGMLTTTTTTINTPIATTTTINTPIACKVVV